MQVCYPVISGQTNISLAITEPGAGSDVANIQVRKLRKRTGGYKDGEFRE